MATTLAGVSLSPATVRVLARCNGYEVAAGGEVVGLVETPVFSGTKLRPDYLLVRLGNRSPAQLRVIPPEAIVAADASARKVFLGLEPGEGEALEAPDARH